VEQQRALIWSLMMQGDKVHPLESTVAVPTISSASLDALVLPLVDLADSGIINVGMETYCIENQEKSVITRRGK
jgi:hypothetical protein